METKLEKMPVSVKVIATLSTEEMTARKEAIYNKKKSEIAVPGFRNGSVPREVAEQKIDIENLYKPLVDEFYMEVHEKYDVVSAKDFLFFGDFKKASPLTMEFVAELKPEVKLPNFLTLEIEKMKSIEITEEEVSNRINSELKMSDKIIDSGKEVIDNFDIAILDFEGTLEGETTPFKGGTAKNHQLCVNELMNGKKNFIDNFEDQIVGMKLNEERVINVKFPDDYRETTLTGKRANFKVTLKGIKQKIVQTLNQEFVTSKGFETIDAYKDNIKKQLTDSMSKQILDDFKRDAVNKVVNASDMTPIPEAMIESESSKEWAALLRRMGRTEAQMKQENKLTKDVFLQNSRQKSEQIVKTSLVLTKVIEHNKLEATDEEIIKYVMNISNILNHDEAKKEKIKKDVETDSYQKELMRRATLNEKAIEFIVDAARHFAK